MSPGGSMLALADPLRLGLTSVTLPAPSPRQHRTSRHSPHASGLWAV